MNPIKLGLLGLFAFIVLILGFGTFYTVDEGERAVITWNGAVTDVAGPGLHYKMPIVEDYHLVSTRTQTYQFDQVASYSKDQQVGTAKLSVTFAVQPGEVQAVYTRFGTIDSLVSRVLQPRVLTTWKTIFGQTTALESTNDQAGLLSKFKTALDTAVGNEITIESVQIENVDFSDTFEANVEARATAEVATRTKQQELLTAKVNADIAVTQAKAQADANLAVARAAAEGSLVQAEADAKATRLRGEAEAAAIDARGKAIAQNANVISLVQAEKWNGVLPTTMVPGSSVPFVNVR